MNRAWKTGILATMGALLSVATVFFGVGPLLALYQGVPRRWFFLWCLPILAGLILIGEPTLWVAFASSMALAVLYAEDQALGGSLLRSGAIAAGGVLGAGLVGTAIWAKIDNFNPALRAKETILASINQLGLSSKLSLDTEALVAQMPSAIVIGVLIALWLGIVLDRRIRFALRLPRTDLGTSIRLSYKLPDAAVWVLIASVAGAFLELGQPGLQVAALNVFNVMVLLYFFQGLSVVATFFRLNRTGYLWRALGYFFLVVQLFLVVGFLGLLDYWFDFRDRMLRKSMETV